MYLNFFFVSSDPDVQQGAVTYHDLNTGICGGALFHEKIAGTEILQSLEIPDPRRLGVFLGRISVVPLPERSMTPTIVLDDLDAQKVQQLFGTCRDAKSDPAWPALRAQYAETPRLIGELYRYGDGSERRMVVVALSPTCSACSFVRSQEAFTTFVRNLPEELRNAAHTLSSLVSDLPQTHPAPTLTFGRGVAEFLCEARDYESLPELNRATYS